MTQTENKNLGERMARVETKLDVIEKKLDEFIECADKKYASKLTEKVVYGLVGMIVTAFVVLLLIKVGWK
jgi:hypothetical protein